MQTLRIDELIIILKQLHPTTVLKVPQLCIAMRDVMRSERIWQELFFHHFECHDKPDEESYKDAFRRKGYGWLYLRPEGRVEIELAVQIRMGSFKVVTTGCYVPSLAPMHVIVRKDMLDKTWLVTVHRKHCGRYGPSKRVWKIFYDFEQAYVYATHEIDRELAERGKDLDTENYSSERDEFDRQSDFFMLLYDPDIYVDDAYVLTIESLAKADIDYTTA